MRSTTLLPLLSRAVSFRPAAALAAIVGLATLQVSGQPPEKPVEQTKGAKAGPDDKTVKAGLAAISKDLAGKPFKRDAPVVSKGGAVPAGGTVYPITPEGFPAVIHFYRNPAGDWFVGIEGAAKILPVKAAVASGEPPKEHPIRDAPQSAETDSEPSDAVVRAGLKALGLLKDGDGQQIRRGKPLLSGGGNRIPVGTTLYPVKVGDYPLAAYFSQDEFNDWRVHLDSMSQPLPIREAAKREPPTSENNEVEVARKLKELEAKIAAEKKRWQEATAVINKLTNNKRTPVREGTQAYFQCVEASKVIQEVEGKADGLKAEKARLEAKLGSLKSDK